jgi:hypothetical protein
MTEITFPKHFIVEHPLRHLDGFGLIACMDRRRIAWSDPVLSGDTLFQQWRGGRWGIGDNIAHSMETNEPGSFVGLGITLAEFSQAIGILLHLKGIITTKHGPACGAIEGAPAIHNGVADAKEDPVVFQTATKFKPDLSEDAFLRVVEAAQRIRESGLASSPEEIKRALSTVTPRNPRITQLGVPTNITSALTPHAELADTPYDNVMFVADYRKDVAFDREGAFGYGWSAYYTSFGVAEQIFGSLPDTVQSAVGSIENVLNTEAAFLGRIAARDIGHRDENGNFHPYPIEIIA